MKPKVLIPISIQFSIRYVVRTGFLGRIREYIDPVILLFLDNKDFEAELLKKGISYIRMPEINLPVDMRHTRAKINYWWQKKYLRSSNTPIDHHRDSLIADENILFKIRKMLIYFVYTIWHRYFGGIHKIIEHEEHVFQSNSQISELKNLILKLKPDAYLSFAPFLLGEEIIGRLANSIGISCFASILSFDNLLRGNRVPVVFDQYFLWNQDMKRQLLRSKPEVSEQNIEIVGPLQFDFYYDKSYLWDEDEWRNRLGLPPDRPVILFGAGFYKIVPNEHHWLNQLDDAIEDGEIKNHPIILFRIHPNDPIDRWEQILENANNVVYDEPWGSSTGGKAQANIDRDGIEKLVSTLCHCQVHVNASSTMTVDGAIFDRPQIGPAYDDQPGRRYDRVVKDLYKREHFLPIIQSGSLELANSKDELVQLINSAFSDSKKLSAERKDMIREICTFDDGKSTERLERAFKSFLQSNGMI